MDSTDIHYVKAFTLVTCNTWCLVAIHQPDEAHSMKNTFQTGEIPGVAIQTDHSRERLRPRRKDSFHEFCLKSCRNKFFLDVTEGYYLLAEARRLNPFLTSHNQ